MSWCHHRERKTLGLGRVISQESHRKPAGVTGVLLLGCRLLTPFVYVLKAHLSMDSKLCLSVRKGEFTYSDREKLEWGLALKEFLSEIISVSY